jgi:hypothetical protein
VFRIGSLGSLGYDHVFDPTFFFLTFLGFPPFVPHSSSASNGVEQRSTPCSTQRIFFSPFLSSFLYLFFSLYFVFSLFPFLYISYLHSTHFLAFSTAAARKYHTSLKFATMLIVSQLSINLCPMPPPLAHLAAARERKYISSRSRANRCPTPVPSITQRQASLCFAIRRQFGLHYHVIHQRAIYFNANDTPLLPARINPNGHSSKLPVNANNVAHLPQRLNANVRNTTNTFRNAYSPCLT